MTQETYASGGSGGGRCVGSHLAAHVKRSRFLRREATCLWSAVRPPFRGSQAVSSKDLPVKPFQHHAEGIGCWPVAAPTAAPRLRCGAAQQVCQVGTRFPTVLPILYDVDREGYDVGRGELPRHAAGQTGAGPIAPASRAVSHRLATLAGRCPSGFTIRARE